MLVPGSLYIFIVHDSGTTFVDKRFSFVKALLSSLMVQGLHPNTTFFLREENKLSIA
jgi:hypothetical protein